MTQYTSSRLILTATFGSLLLGMSIGQADEPLRTGQLKSVLQSLNREGTAMIRDRADWLLDREYVQHILFMSTDPRGGSGGGGWYRPSQSKFDWAWLKKHSDKDGDGMITIQEFPGRRDWFESLDKDRDGSLGAEDFDWTSDSAISKASAKTRPVFDRVDLDSNGRISEDEWHRWFSSMAKGRDYLGLDDLTPLFMEPKPRGKFPPSPKGSTSNVRLLVACAYLSGDVGSLSEGPRVGEMGPDFTLQTVDGKGKITLSRARGEKPLVLIFGSFT